MIGICYYGIVLKEEKKKHKYTTHINFYEDTCSNKQNIKYVIISVNLLFLKIHGTSQ